MAIRGLPGGRGPRYGKDSYVDQMESYEQRKALQEKRGGWQAGTGSLTSEVTTGAFPANRMFLVPLQDVQAVHSLNTARISVSLGASGTAEAAIYRWDGLGQDKFKQLPNSSFSFNTATLAVVETLGQREVKLFPGEHYFVGFVSSSVSPEFVCVGLTGAQRPLKVRYKDTAYPLPGQVKLSETTVSYTANIPFITFLSTEAALVL